MKFTKCEIEGLLILEPKIFGDERGCFFESYNQELFDKETKSQFRFLQDNHSLSNKNVVRGLHFQAPPFDQGKLVCVVKGSVLDVVVDIRTKSPTFGQHFSIVLTGENYVQFWIPPGFAHGFATLEDQTIFQYKCTNFYQPSSEDCVLWSDNQLDINWQVDQPIISEKDKKGKLWKELRSPF